MLIIDPPIGSFSPLNRDRLLAEGVGMTIDVAAAQSLGDTLGHREGRDKLLRMAEARWGHYAINGFERAAEFLTGLQPGGPGGS